MNKKISVKDLREINKEVNNTLAIPFKDYSIEVKQYLPVLDKITLVSTAYQSSIDKEDTLQVINHNSLDVIFKVLIVKTYTDVSLPKDTIQAYDLIMQSGLYDTVYQSIPSQETQELDNTLINYITEKENRYEKENTLPNVFKNTLNKLIDKMPSTDEAKKLIEDVGKDIENFDPAKLKFIQDFMKVNQGESVGNI